MERKLKISIARTALVLLIALLLQNCTPDVAKRNKYPEFTNSNNGRYDGFMPDMQNTNNYGGLTTSYINLSYDGVEKQFTCVKLDAANDLQILGLISLFKPFAGTLIPQLPAQQKSGIVIDMRGTTTDETNHKRADYLIGNADGSGIPVVFLWDNSSSQRAAAYMAQLGDVPGLSVKMHNN